MERGKTKLKDSVYALEDPSVPGLYIRLGSLPGEEPRLTPRQFSTLAPASPEYRIALCARRPATSPAARARAH